MDKWMGHRCTYSIVFGPMFVINVLLSWRQCQWEWCAGMSATAACWFTGFHFHWCKVNLCGRSAAPTCTLASFNPHPSGQASTMQGAGIQRRLSGEWRYVDTHSSTLCDSFTLIIFSINRNIDTDLFQFTKQHQSTGTHSSAQVKQSAHSYY